eukprot:1051691_1
MAFTFVFVAFIAFFSYLFCNRIRSICPSLSSCQDLPKRRENSIPLQRYSDLMTIKGSGWSVDFAVDEKGDVVIDKYKQMKTRRGAVAPYTKPSYEMKRKNKNK